jgi:hypothetical protein
LPLFIPTGKNQISLFNIIKETTDYDSEYSI